MILYRQNYAALRHVPQPQSTPAPEEVVATPKPRRRKSRVRTRLDAPILTTRPAFDLLNRIENLNFARGFNDSLIGEQAVGDRRLISTIRQGRRLREQTRERLVAFLEMAERGEIAFDQDRLLPKERVRGKAGDASDVLARIERVIVDKGIPASRIGRRAVNDPGLVERLRAGGSIREATRQRIVAYLAKLEWRP